VAFVSVSDADRARVAAQVLGTLRGRRPDEDDSFRATTEAGAGDFVRLMADEASMMLEGKPADRVLAWAAAVVPRFVVTSSFGAESAVLLHLVSKVAPHIPVFFLDTGFHFDATINFRRELAHDLGLTVLDLRPDRSVSQQLRELGDLPAIDPDRCCQLRKTVPLRRALASFDGWATGVRRVQTPERAMTPVVEAREHDGRWLVKVAPLAGWANRDVERYLHLHDLPRHPMSDDGYPSIGCAPCTKQVAPDQDPRAGRWASFADKTECGIHLDDDPIAVRTTTTPG
jgi:phosphoadenosine phosphosulfate reductase